MFSAINMSAGPSNPSALWKSIPPHNNTLGIPTNQPATHCRNVLPGHFIKLITLPTAGMKENGGSPGGQVVRKVVVHLHLPHFYGHNTKSDCENDEGIGQGVEGIKWNYGIANWIWNSCSRY